MQQSIKPLLSRVRRGAGDVFGGVPLLFGSIALGLLVVCTLFEMNWRAFPYWDYAFYQDETFAVADAFGHSLGEGLRLVASSLNGDYNLLLTVPLVPLIWIFGETRLVYIFDLLIVYFMPFVIIVSVLARRVFPESKREAGIIAALVAVATPLTWENVLQGYPDIGGAILICAMLLAYGSSDRGKNWKWLIACGVFAALAILFRRGYVYAAFSLYVAFAADMALAYVRGRDVKQMVRPVAALAASGFIMVALVALVAPAFVARVGSPDYLHTFSPWEMAPSGAFALMVGMIGVPVLCVALVGMFVPKRTTTEGQTLTRVIGIGSAVWALTWLIVVRQGPSHYPHVLPYLVIIGVTGSLLYVRAYPDVLVRRIGVWALTVLLVVGTFIAIPFSRPAFALQHVLPPYTFPATMMPLVNPAYDEVLRLVVFLRSYAGPNDSIVVASGSETLNWDLLREAEHTLFGPANGKLNVAYVPQTNAEEVPADTLQHAKYVVVAVPFQHHLRAEDQKPVHVLVDVFEQKWPMSRDFELLQERFVLGPGVSGLVYRRTRESSLEVAARTRQQMQQYLSSPTAGAPAGSDWVEVSSPYPVEVVGAAGGASNVKLASPARASQQPQTVLALVDDRHDGVLISGEVGFYDSRCAGAQIVMATQRNGPRFTVAGSFTPKGSFRRFDVSVQHVRGNPVFLEIAALAGAPENVDYCSIHIDGLTVRPAGKPLDAATAVSLRSVANPFVTVTATAAPATQVATASEAGWALKSSPFPGGVTRIGNGTYRFSGHPTRRDQQVETVIEMPASPMKGARISGSVFFYTPTCKGAQIVAGTEYGSSGPETSVGVFTPQTSGTPFDVVVPNVAGKTVYLKFKSNPSTPDDITSCTLHVEDLRVRPAG